MTSFLKDPMFFYFIAFVIFMSLVWRYGRKPLLSWIDGEIRKIRQELEQAKKLRVEAEAMLVAYQKKFAEAMIEADKIIRHAEEEAARFKIQSDLELKEALKRQEQQVLDRIRVSEVEAVAAVQSAAVDLAMDLAKKKLAALQDDVTSTRIADQAILEIPALVANKAKAA